MSQYFSKKALISFGLFTFFVYSKDANPEVFKCSPETLDALCGV